MRNTTICYIERDNKYLMLHRIKKDASVDPSHNKWIGVGGHFEKDESPEDCLLREVKEETGLTLREYCLRGIITFVSNEWGTEYMYLYTATKYEGTLIECDEGELVWVPKDKLSELTLWEGDRIFLRLLDEEKRFFSLKLHYEGEKLAETVLQCY